MTNKIPNLKDIISAISISKSRLECYNHLNISKSSYLQKITCEIISDNNIDISHFDRSFKHFDYSDSVFLENLKKIVSECDSMNQVIIALNRSPLSGSGKSMLKKHMIANNIDFSHFTGQGHLRNKKLGFRYPIEDYFSGKRKISSFNFKKRLVEENILENKCSICNVNEWNNKQISLQIDHKNGNHFDNSLANVRIICASCHASTPNFRKANKNATYPVTAVKQNLDLKTVKSKDSIELQNAVLKSSKLSELISILNKEDNHEVRKYIRNKIKRYQIDISHFNEEKEYHDKLKEVVPQSSSYHNVLEKLGKCAFGANYPKVISDIKKLGISTDNFGPKNYSGDGKDFTIYDVLTNKHPIKSYQLRRMLLKYDLIDEVCQICKTYDKIISSGLELDHKDGNNLNNSLDNLRFLCPNCHSQTDTYAGKNKGKVNNTTAAQKSNE